MSVAAIGCATSSVDDGHGGATGTSATTGTSVSTATGSGGSGGSASLCMQDCSKITTPTCLKAVCNDGSYQGQIGSCVVVPDDGAACDDGKFCTVNDTCSAGMCVGGPQNDCGMTPPDCNTISCNEASASCGLSPMGEGEACTPSGDLCMSNASCHNGSCVGTKKDCSFSSLNECNVVACNPANGQCEGAPEPAKNGNTCKLSGDLCSTNKTCLNGACQGGTPKNCSSLTHDCVNGVCNAANGVCEAITVPVGGTCLAASSQCVQGICDAMGKCNGMPASNGMACNDFDVCTSNDMCNAGTCGGTMVVGCQVYLNTAFENCPSSWTFTGEWQCGVPVTPISGSHPPSGAHSGTKVIGTALAGNYAASDAYATNTATSPTIDLTTATSPIAHFYMWVDTEPTYDGVNFRVSKDGGAFDLIGTGSLCTPANSCKSTTTSKPYSTSLVGSQPAWSGHEDPLGWQLVTVDLSAYVGHSIQIRLSFRSDGSGEYSGVYVDDFLVGESSAIP